MQVPKQEQIAEIESSIKDVNAKLKDIQQKGVELQKQLKQKAEVKENIQNESDQEQNQSQQGNVQIKGNKFPPDQVGQVQEGWVAKAIQMLHGQLIKSTQLMHQENRRHFIILDFIQNAILVINKISGQLHQVHFQFGNKFTISAYRQTVALIKRIGQTLSRLLNLTTQAQIQQRQALALHSQALAAVNNNDVLGRMMDKFYRERSRMKEQPQKPQKQEIRQNNKNKPKQQERPKKKFTFQGLPTRSSIKRKYMDHLDLQKQVGYVDQKENWADLQIDGSSGNKKQKAEYLIQDLDNYEQFNPDLQLMEQKEASEINYEDYQMDYNVSTIDFIRGLI